MPRLVKKKQNKKKQKISCAPSPPSYFYPFFLLFIIYVQVVKETVDPSATIEFKPNTADDPHKRKPDISKAKELLRWEPKVSLREGLPLMVSDFSKRILNK